MRELAQLKVLYSLTNMHKTYGLDRFGGWGLTNKTRSVSPLRAFFWLHDNVGAHKAKIAVNERYQNSKFMDNVENMIILAS